MKTYTSSEYKEELSKISKPITRSSCIKLTSELYEKFKDEPVEKVLSLRNSHEDNPRVYYTINLMYRQIYDTYLNRLYSLYIEELSDPDYSAWRFNYYTRFIDFINVLVESEDIIFHVVNIPEVYGM